MKKAFKRFANKKSVENQMKYFEYSSWGLSDIRLENWFWFPFKSDKAHRVWRDREKITKIKHR